MLSAFLCSLLLSTSYAQASNSTGYDYNGGVSIRYPNTSCPAGTFYEGTSYQPSCCPYGTFPPPNGTTGYCCPTADDCKQQVTDNIKCADPSWEYCPSPTNNAIGFCCLEGWVCYEQFSNGAFEGVACGAPGYQLQVAESAVPTAWAAYDGPGQTTTTSTTTSSSSQSSTQITSSSTPGSTSPPSPTSAASPKSTPSSSPSPTSGLSTTAKIGVGVGVGVGGALLLAAGIYAYFRYRNKRKPRDAEVLVYPNSKAEIPGGFSRGVPNDTAKFYDPVVSNGAVDLHGAVGELDGLAAIHELPTEWEGNEVPAAGRAWKP